jgi:tetratricopeptide (TPR) repeat protein
MKRKYAQAHSDDDDDLSNKRIRVELDLEQPNIAHFDEYALEFWNYIVKTMRASNLYKELRVLGTYLDEIQIIKVDQIILKQLKVLCIKNENNPYYYLAQYGITRLQEGSQIEGKMKRVEELMEKLLLMNQQDNSNLWIHNLFIMFLLRSCMEYSRLFEFEKAFSCYDILDEVHPNFPALNGYKGYTLLNARRYEESIYYFDLALAQHPTSWYCYHNRGCAKMELDRFNDAIEDYNKATQFIPKFYIGFLKKGLAYSKLRKTDLAIQCFTECLMINPSVLHALEARSLEYSKLGLFIHALRDCRSRQFCLTQHSDPSKKYLKKIQKSCRDELFQS